MDLFTHSLALEVEAATERLPYSASCTTCRGAAHPSNEACTAACHACGSREELRIAGGRFHCPVGSCAGAGATPIEHEPVPSRRGRWGSHGDRTLPAFHVRFDAPTAGSGFVGRYPTAEHALAHAHLLYDKRVATNPKAAITARPATGRTDRARDSAPPTTPTTT